MAELIGVFSEPVRGFKADDGDGRCGNIELNEKLERDDNLGGWQGCNARLPVLSIWFF
ncbi:hypothetical protein [Celerinatantimonas sp. YJH-8]|uniref:hypothetical protein n=1 Tax=Celerinatantimonas sp. YJH-8 TaxID=3228714 RepID=UPI0038CB4D06